MENKELGTIGQGERAPTNGKGLVEQKENKDRSKDVNKKGRGKKKEIERHRKKDEENERNINDGSKTPIQESNEWIANINIHTDKNIDAD